MKNVIYLFVVILSFSSVCLYGSEYKNYYVATNGNDVATGLSLGSAWKTIQHAVDSVSSGDSIYVRGGVYKERVSFSLSGSTNKSLQLLAYSNEVPILDGGSLTVGDMDALIEIDGYSNIEISGFEIRNFSTSNRWHVPVGIYVHGASTNISIANINIHHIENSYDNGGNAVLGADAHGLAVYGDNASGSVSNIRIANIVISNCLLGSSEALVLNGNVDGFSVSQCQVNDNNNIGIVFIGHEGVCANPALDQARNGVCSDNLVYNINTIGNPAYRSGSGYDRSADGIYVDGGKQIIIERNIIHDCDVCMEVASEHGGKSASFITVRNNLIINGYTGGIFCGGYDNTRGSAVSCKFIGNTLYHNNTVKDYSGEITLQYYITNCLFRNNILVALANGGGDAVYFGGPGGAGSLPLQTTINYNLYYSDESSSPSWRWGNNEYYQFNDWLVAGNDTNGVYGVDPILIDPVHTNFNLQTNSLAINIGENRQDIGNTDLGNNKRVVEGRVDIGAYETQPVTSHGTPYSWLEQYNLVSNNYESADLADVDSDYSLAWQEYVADTNPTNGNDVFRIIDIIEDSSINILFNSSANRYYLLLLSSNFVSSLWQPLSGTSPRIGIGGADIMQDISSSNRISYYRLSVQLQP